MQLSQQAYAAARLWLDEQGRPLEQALCAMYFDNGPSRAVTDALAAFQNPDGGYGRCLEPDHTDDNSTPLNTSIALAIHRRLSTPSDHPQIVRAVAYLQATYDPERKVWPIRQPVKPGAQGPPWFTAESLDALIASFGGCRFNPTAEIVGYLYDHAAGAVPDWLNDACECLFAGLLDNTTELTQHDLMCTAHLLASSALPDEQQTQLMKVMTDRLPEAIESDTRQWHGYAFRPTIVIDEPSHVLKRCVPDELLWADLDYEINRQAADGAWHPFWDWGEQTADGWERAEQAWSSILTERTLRVLAGFGRMA